MSSILPGSRFGPYEVKGVLGSGGMGDVYLARDERLGRQVALKVLPTGLTSDPNRLRRFEQEARTSGLAGIVDSGGAAADEWVIPLDGAARRLVQLSTDKRPRGVTWARQTASD